MSDDRIDLSTLDPSRDRERWDARVNEVATRARALAERSTVSRQLHSWARPVLAIAASLALVSWAGALASQRDSAAQQAADPAWELSRVVAQGESPSAAAILQLLGGSHGNP